MSMVLSNALSQVSLFGGALELPAAASIAPGASSPTGASVVPSPPANGAGVSGLESGLSGVAGTTHAPFADLVTEAVGQIERYEVEAKASIEGLISGRGVDVHQAMIATDKAEAGFELVLAVRNKALSAYQQVMGLQF